MTRSWAVPAVGLALSACAVPAATGTAPAVGRFPPTTVPPPPAGTGPLIGMNVAELTRLLGQPTREIREGDAVKLQFRGADCVLDAYLYPGARGGGAAVAHVDTRLADGRDTDRAGCVARLQQRPGAGRE